MTQKSCDTMDSSGTPGATESISGGAHALQDRVRALEDAVRAAYDALAAGECTRGVDLLAGALDPERPLKTRDEVENLKRLWLAEGVMEWDPEDEPGFEAYYHELVAFRLAHENAGLREDLKARRETLRAFKQLLENT